MSSFWIVVLHRFGLLNLAPQSRQTFTTLLSVTCTLRFLNVVRFYWKILWIHSVCTDTSSLKYDTLAWERSFWIHDRVTWRSGAEIYMYDISNWGFCAWRFMRLSPSWTDMHYQQQQSGSMAGRQTISRWVSRVHFRNLILIRGRGNWKKNLAVLAATIAGTPSVHSATSATRSSFLFSSWVSTRLVMNMRADVEKRTRNTRRGATQYPPARSVRK